MRILSSVLRYFLLGIPSILSILRLGRFLHAFLPLFFLIIHIRGFCHLTANISAVIQQNQTASDLQIKYDLSYYTLQKANEETDLDGLKAGDVVCVPAFNVPCPLPETVTLKAGDTLESTALAYNLPISSLLRANPCLSPADFIEGAQIKLPK